MNEQSFRNAHTALKEINDILNDTGKLEYEKPELIKNKIQKYKDENRFYNEDDVCPMTGNLCDDECCPPGSECNCSDFSINPDHGRQVGDDPPQNLVELP